MKTYLSSLRKAGVLLVAALMAMAAASCSDDKTTATPLDAPAISAGDKTVSTLAFSWSKVEGASQYAYELLDPDGSTVTGGVTTATSMAATGLKANTEYTLKVWAYGPYGGDKSTSPTVELKATTNDYTQLAQVQNITAGSGVGSVTVTWPAVDHADGYTYVVRNDADSIVAQGTTDTNSFTANLDLGTYKGTIVATSTDENYSQSEPVTFEFECSKGEKWRRNGTLTSAILGKTFKATLVAYADGTYEILNPYGDEGYSIAFKTETNGCITITNATTVDGYGYYSQWVSQTYYASMYTSVANSYNYSEFIGNEDGGSMWWGSYLYTADGTDLGWGYEEFAWTADDVQVDEIPAGCKEQVEPLLSTTWWQYAPYNNLVPTISDGSHAATGCMATAMAQIMNYYKYPATYADGTAIDWDNMLTAYTDTYGTLLSSTDAQTNAVATLMSRLGEVLNMTYGSTSTCYANAVEMYIPAAFGYKVKYYGYRDYPEDKDAAKWKAIIFRELSAGHPVLYGGTSYLNGQDNYFSHAFVLDGYKKNGQVHVNYGFGGNGDGWVSIDKMSMTGVYGWNDEEFSTYQTLTVIHRPQDGDIDYDL